MKKFKVNEFLTVKLEEDKTCIYVNGEFFNQCKSLLLNIPVNEFTTFDEIESIDDAAEMLDKTLEGESVFYYDIPAETEFWAHCSNLQAWTENNYNTNLLHSNLAFPLLKKLVEAGDLAAKKVFKEEIAKRFMSGNVNIITYLVDDGYLDILSKEEIDTIAKELDFEKIKDKAYISEILNDFEKNYLKRSRKKNRYRF